MKKIFVGIIALSILLMAAVSFARPWGIGQGAENSSVEEKQFFDATRDLRKEMHDKRFELMELSRTGTDQARMEALEADVEELRAKIQAKAAEFGITGGPGNCNNQGADCGIGQGCGKRQSRNCDGAGQCNSQLASRGCGNKSRCGQ